MKKWTEFSCLYEIFSKFKRIRYDFDEKHRRDSRFRVFVSFTDFVFFILHIIEWVLKMKKWLFSPAPKVKSKRLLHHRWLITYFPFWSFLNEFQMPFKLTVVIYVSLLIYIKGRFVLCICRWHLLWYAHSVRLWHRTVKMWSHHQLWCVYVLRNLFK